MTPEDKWNIALQFTDIHNVLRGHAQQSLHISKLLNSNDHVVSKTKNQSPYVTNTPMFTNII